MEEMITHSYLEVWLLNWGSLAIFFLLAVGIIALPVPEETLMVVAGALIEGGRLHLGSTFFAAFLGSICGISVSYFLGRSIGHFIIHHFGKWLGIKQKQIQTAHNWVEKYGGWAIFTGYFIPGIRHFTGFSAGATDLQYSRFALFAFPGALCWVTTFLSLGYFLGEHCSYLCYYLEDRIDNILSLLILLIALLGLYLTHRKSIQN